MVPPATSPSYLRLVHPPAPRRRDTTPLTPVPSVHTPVDDEERRWIDAAAAGDVAAFRCLYDRYLHVVAGQVGRLLGPRSDVEDVVQDVFVHVFRSLDRFRGDAKFSTWLWRITFNVAISHRRRLGRAPATVELEAFHATHAEWARLEARDRARLLYAALDGIDDDARDAFVLHEIEGLTLREIAELCELSINTVAARVRRTREKLVAVLVAAEHGPGGAA